jgi:hypothetical protein
MPYAADRAASRFGRDRDLLPDAPRTGPYESAYDVRRGYDQPLERAPRRDVSGEVLRLAGREDGRGG